ncbi:MAG: YkgJ family cysteine cluster protein [Candidatus Omnitrophica bacterium]|nr:YkgJ family cysteine cluster protein [Candidatus Omnitrophota bacterium]
MGRPDNIHNSNLWKCKQDGDCCSLFVFTGVVVTDKEWDLLEKDILSLKLPAPIFKTCKIQKTLPTLGKKPPKRCVFLKRKNTCMIYKNRPQRCREYPLMIQQYKKVVKVNISQDCPRGEELSRMLRKDSPHWFKKIVKNKKVEISVFSFYDNSISQYYDEES